MARSGSAAAQVPDADIEYREIIRWYEDQLANSAPPTDLEWEPVRIGPTWQYENGWVLPAATLGWRNLAWAGLRLKNKHGGPWVYTLEQARFLLWFWALDGSGEFTYHSATLQRLKGWGKDPIAACVSSTDICSEDAAFDHWNGDIPVGREQPNAWVQIAAVAQVQTQNTMKLFPSLLPLETRRKYGIQIGKLNVWAKGDEAQIEAVTSNPLALEGGRPTLIIRNEPQNWVSSNGGHEMAGAIEGNAAKSEDGAARMLDICNAYRPGSDSVGQRSREGWEKTQGSRCERHADDTDWPAKCRDCQPPEQADYGVMYDSLEAPPEAPLTAEAAPSVIEAIRGDSTWLNIRRIIKSILNPLNSASESRRKWYNQITAMEDDRFDPLKVRLCETVDTLQPGDEIVMFGDGSKSDDASGLVACRMSDGLTQVLHVQQPRKKKLVDRAAYSLAVADAMTAYKVVAFWFDPSHAKDDDAEGEESFWMPSCDEWMRLYGRRLKFWATRSGDKKHAIVFDMASPVKQALFVPAVERMETDIDNGEFRFAKSGWLKRHLTNAKRHPGKFGVSMRKENRESAKKIDLAVCAVGARMLWRLVQLDRVNTTRKKAPGKGRVIALD